MGFAQVVADNLTCIQVYLFMSTHDLTRDLAHAASNVILIKLHVP